MGKGDRIVVFDGVCNFCNGAVNFIINRDPQALYCFVPLQSELGQKLVANSGVSFDTMLLIEGDSVKVKSDAALSIAECLTQPWPLFRVFKILPVGFRDFFYDLIARNRYRLFGKRENCMVPNKDVRSRFKEEVTDGN